jgi:hypothetical protein
MIRDRQFKVCRRCGEKWDKDLAKARTVAKEVANEMQESKT